MNNYIILFLIIIFLIILFFTYNYDKKNIEKFGNQSQKKYNSSVVSILANNYLGQSPNGTIAIRKKDGTNTGIVINSGIISVGNNFSFDPSNNNLKCGNFNIDKDNKLKFDNNTDNINNKITFDPSGNLVLDNYIYDNNTKKILNKNNNLKIDDTGTIGINDFVYNSNTKELNKNDNSIKVDTNGNILFGQFKYNVSGNLIKLNENNIETQIFDPNGNINLGEYMYSTDGSIAKKDNSVIIDPSGNINTEDYEINLINKNVRKKDGSLSIVNGIAKCDNYESNPNVIDGNKIKLGNNTYFLNNGIFRNDTNTISINSTDVKMNSNKYNYNLASKVLSGNDGLINKFIISAPPATDITLGQTTPLSYNYDGIGNIR